ncbi:MAG: quinonprotein alcohol dehydrogenase, partial [Microgenomates group bacterium GW2011_GWC1_39_7]
YEFLKENGIKAVSLFTLEDFELSLSKKRDEIRTNFEILWRFQSPNPNYFYRVPKSAPVIDDQKLYFGSDSGYFWAIDKKGGSSVWKYKVGWHAKGKSIFSSPALWNNFVYFGSYDGNVYALDKNTGKVKWIFMEADWVGSSPAVAPDLGLVFIGLEFGLWRKRGGIVALDLETGEKKWDFIMSEYTHSSPVYDKKCGVVAIGSNDCKVYLFNAQNGKLLWEFQAGGEIKASLCIDDKRKLLIFGAFDGYIYMLNLSSGELLYKFKTLAAIYSAPVIYENNVIVSSLDKKIYSINLDTKGLNWDYQCGGRAMTTPLIVEQSIWVGATDGAIYEIEASSGKLLSIFRTTERITNRPAYDLESKIVYPPLMMRFARNFPQLASGKVPRSDYFLIVSRLVPYKRVDIAIKAANKLKIPLKIIGEGSEYPRLRKMAGKTVEFLGYVSDPDLKYYYMNCKALLFPGVEDFGLTIVEANAAGKPVIAYRGGGAEEIIIEGKTGEFFDSQTAASLTEVLKKFKPNRYNTRACKLNANRFSFERFRENFLKLVE